jgi:hypothetical protein
VDNNAARLRYIQRSAIELPQLTDLPIPFLDILTGSGGSRTTTPEPSVHSTLAHDRAVRGALAIRRAMYSGKLDSLDVSSAASVLLIETSASHCAAPEARSAWTRSVRWISDSTAAYLSAAELAEIWNRVRSSPCYREVAGEHQTWADLYAAIAARDASAIVKSGTELLSAQSSRSGSELTYLTMAVATAHMRMGELAAARSLLQTQWGRLDHSQLYQLPLLELLVLSQISQSPQVAGLRR